MRIASEAWFRGRWRMARVIADRRGARATFAGTCRFAPDGAGLVCEERGVLRQGGGRYRAGRVTLWRFPGDGRICVLFADARPFHAFHESRPQALHLCGADRYAVSYAFEAHRWLSRWVVRGPAKDYVMTTRYRRA